MDEIKPEVVYRFGGTDFSFPIDTPEAEVKRLIGKVYPAVKNSEFRKEEDGSYSILVIEGELG